MLTPAPARRRSVDARVRASGVLALGSFAVAAACRIAVDRVAAGFETLNTIAAVGASAAGLGVLLFGATLVLAVQHHRGRRLPLVLGGVTALLALGAVAAAVVATTAPDVGAASNATIVRTALAGLAAASLPAVCLAALRER
ncbi:hypothetical protein [Curtobacterium sp. ZW137]|uniref:hypothetical protein n=1 Tax=Curtobacterium sp. ZW137 TaxID=2485104 RepID=UPI000F4D0DDB|nr:hypothetical protein [Curtobacterium sp. ZW137]